MDPGPACGGSGTLASRFSCAVLACIGCCASRVPGQNNLWENGAWDGQANLASERNTEIPDAWTIDDVVFDADVRITGYRWYSLLADGFEPVGADFIALTDGFSKAVELRDLQYRSEFLGYSRGRPYFWMEIDGLDIQLPAGHWFLGARPVGQGQYRAFTLLNRPILGRSEAYFRSAFFGYPEWTSCANVGVGPYDIAFTVFGHVVREEIEAESFTVPLGRLLSGEVADLRESDDRYVTIRNRALMALTLPMIRMEVQGTTAVETASRITVTVETAASILPKQPLQRLALFDYIAERWITIDERATTIIDTSIEIIVEDDPTRFIAPGTGQLRMRLDWLDPGATTPWGVRIDHANWTVER